jgi:hypothetical protein
VVDQLIMMNCCPEKKGDGAFSPELVATLLQVASSGKPSSVET